MHGGGHAALQRRVGELLVAHDRIARADGTAAKEVVLAKDRGRVVVRRVDLFDGRWEQDGVGAGVVDTATKPVVELVLLPVKGDRVLGVDALDEDEPLWTAHEDEYLFVAEVLGEPPSK